MQQRKYNIKLSKNEAFELTVVFTDNGANPIPLSAINGDTKMQVRTYNDVSAPLITTVSLSTSTLSNFSVPTFYFPPDNNNMFVLYIPQPSIEGLPFGAMEIGKRYFYDLVAVVDRVPRSPKVLLSGTIQIESGVTDVP
jgi:hypothetical protein